MRRCATWSLAVWIASAPASYGSGNTAAPPVERGAAALPRIDFSTSLLIVAPHPDDETLCCAGVIQRVLHAGGQVSIVWLTSGDAARMDLILMSHSLFPATTVARGLGAQRMEEARTASSRLGVLSTGRLFLGYPDGGLLELLGAHRTTPFTSSTTGAAAVPYSDALHPGHPYTGESLERDFLEVLERVRPNLILAPTPLDAHADHRAAGLLVQSLSARSPGPPEVRYWIVHGGAGWPAPADLMQGIPLTAAPLAQPLSPTAFELEPAEEDAKLSALQAYRTQLRLTAPFLLSFVRTNELYSLRAH